MPRAASRLNTLLVATLFILLAASIPRLHAQVPLTDVIDVAAGSAHACALKTDGTVVCWGGNEYGQLGNGTTTDSLVAVPVSGLNSVISIEAGLSHTCALRSDGSVFCWGHNARGQLGDGTTTTRLTPAAVSGLGASVSSIAAGYRHTCVIAGTGAAECWGDNGFGQLGDGTTLQRLTPVAVYGLASNIGDISAGGHHTCAVRASNGRTFCWGLNNYGQLGDGTTINRVTPTDIFATVAVASVHLGFLHSCFVSDQGTAACWGDNYYGQLGDGSLAPRSIPTLVLSAGSGAQSLALGISHSCMRWESGYLSCWGSNNEGQLGDGSGVTQLYPRSVQIGTTDAMDSGAYFSCAVTAGDHRVMCWGSNDYGQLGDGTTQDRLVPVFVQQIAPAPEIFINGFE